MPDLDASFGLPGSGAPLQVRAWLVRGHRITRPDETDSVPVYIASGRGAQVDAFIDAEHPIFVDFGVDTRDLVVIELAEFLRIRDRSTRSLSAMFAELKERCLPDHKISGPFLTELASQTLNRIREVMQPVVEGNATGYWSLLSANEQSAAERRFANVHGASTYIDPKQAPVTGQYHVLPSGTELPDGLAIHADGQDVGGSAPVGHGTIYPTKPMTVSEFGDKFNSLPWEWAGKK
jgi:hypothetical protein